MEEREVIRVEEKEEEKGEEICGTCKHYDYDKSYCPEEGGTRYELDCCDDGWEEGD